MTRSEPAPVLQPEARRRQPVQFFAFFGFTFVSLQYVKSVRGYSPLIATLAVPPDRGDDADVASYRHCGVPVRRPRGVRHRAPPGRRRAGGHLPRRDRHALLADAGRPGPARRRHGSRHDPRYLGDHRVRVATLLSQDARIRRAGRSEQPQLACVTEQTPAVS